MNKRLHLLLVLLFLTLSSCLWAQPHFPVNGVEDNRQQSWLLTHANIVTAPGQLLENADMRIKDGKIEAIGKDLEAPKGYQLVDMQGKYIYPGLLDLYSDYGLPASNSGNRGRGNAPQLFPARAGAFGANDAIRSDQSAAAHFQISEKEAERIRKAGFSAVLTHQQDGIARGEGALVALGNGTANEQLLLPAAAAWFSFNKGSSTQDYPSSLMGSIALLRQTALDARWYAKQNKAIRDLSLEAWNQQLSLPLFFDAPAKFDLLRADKIGDEFGLSFIMRASGEEYQYLDAVKASGAALVVPLNFPDAYDVEDPLDAHLVSLAQMKHWEMAPGNLAALEKAGISFSITRDGLDAAAFWSNLRLAIAYGLSEKAALEALTTRPAQMLRVENRLGTLEKGKIANFLVCSGPLFDADTDIYDNWILGKRYTVQKWPENSDIRAYYRLQLPEKPAYTLRIQGKASRPEASIVINDSTTQKVNISYAQGFWTLWFTAKTGPLTGTHRLSLWRSGNDLNGRYEDAQAKAYPVMLTYDSAYIEKNKAEKAKKPATIGYLPSPFADLGWDSLPAKSTYFFKGAQLWTNEKEGVFTGDLVVKDGKIAAMGTKLDPAAYGKSVVVIDAAGKHLSPGIIDEHSHIAIYRGVNEGSRSITSEVRIGDVLNPDDVNIYRQLAGGVTSSHLLHGSANTIGGQSQLIKLRWGVTHPDALKFENAPGFIKFALGENVKQSNWGDRQTIRFPQTRMGVEQILVDGFKQAQQYEANKQKDPNTRRDLRLDALNEIRNGQRHITCHSYVQSEINMLMQVADSLGFKVNTFTHILEGYKVADKMKKHGAQASTFADWWAYKMEVSDAIPHNAAIMMREGVNVAINSDDAEMARRLNQEAAKSVMYAGISEEEAFKMVTLNPAKMLKVDQRVGSLKVGKDADLVLWSDNPLSVYSRAEITLVDGIIRYDSKSAAVQMEKIRLERQRLMAKMLEAKKSGAKTSKPSFYEEKFWHCDTFGEEAE